MQHLLDTNAWIVRTTLLAFIAARLIASNHGPGFGRELLGAFAVLLLVYRVSSLMCRVLADIPPTIDGRELTLVPGERKTAFWRGHAANFPRSVPQATRGGNRVIADSLSLISVLRITQVG